MTVQLLWMGAIASIAHLVGAVWWYRNGWRPFRAFGAVILGGNGIIAAYVVIRLWVEGSVT